MPDSASAVSFAGPISTERVSDVVAERLRAAITDGTLKPGDRLPTESRLAADFGVGRTSVREGMQKLRALGLIESRKGLGTFVRTDPVTEFVQWTNADTSSIVELLEVRTSLDTLAAALAAVRATEAERLRILRLALAPTGLSGGPDDITALVAWDEGFHRTIVAAARNPVLSRVYGVLIDGLKEFRRHSLALPWAVERSEKDHGVIAAAINQRDPTQARRAMADHHWALYADVIQNAAPDRVATVAPAPRSALG